MSYLLSSILSRGRLVLTLDPKTQIRGAKIRIRKPSQPTFDKKLMMAVAEPFQWIDRRPSWEKCKFPEFVEKRRQDLNEVHPWAVIKARKLKEKLMSSNIVLVMHENCVDEEDGRVLRNTITKAGFTVTNSNRAVARLAFEGTQYDFLLGQGKEERERVTGQRQEERERIVGQSQEERERVTGQSQEERERIVGQSQEERERIVGQSQEERERIVGHGTIAHTVYILGPDSSKLKEILDVIKKMPTYLLLFGIIDGNHVLRRDQLVEVANYPSLDHKRGELVSTLNQVMASIISNVQNPSYNLTLNLDSYSKQLENN